MNSWCLLATESLKVGLYDSAIQQFNKAYQISRELKGEDHEQTASYLINIANAFSQAARDTDAIGVYENASLILAKIDSEPGPTCP